MPDRRCPANEELLAFAALRLDDAGFARVASHLGTCDLCRSKVQEQNEPSEPELTIASRASGFPEAESGSLFESEDKQQPPTKLEVTQQSVLTELADSLEGNPGVSLRSASSEAEGFESQFESQVEDSSHATNRYELKDEIARGGMGAILRAKDKDLGRSIAVKVLLDEHKKKPKVIQRFVEEAQIGGQLQHPGIAPVYELGRFADERPFFSMKLVKGETLSALLKLRKDPAEDRGKFIGIFEQICQTVAYAHSRGVIHRDLKPGNVMVGAFGEVQVMDWGLAKVLPKDGSNAMLEVKEASAEQSIIHTPRSGGETTAADTGHSGELDTMMGTVMGTPSFMPPEQALGRIDLLDERVDVFGLGAILCQILTGKPPYLGRESSAVLKLARMGALSECLERLDSSSADSDLIQLTKDCLQVNPENRPRDAGVLAVRVTKYIESVETKLQASEVERAAEAARAEEERKRRRISLTMAAVVLLVVATASAMWMDMERKNSERQAMHAAELESINQSLEKQNAAERQARLIAEIARDEADAARAEEQKSRRVADLARTESESVSDFLVGLFEDADPIARTERSFGAQRRGEGEMLAVEIVNRGRQKLETELLEQSRIRAVLLDKIGNVYLSLGKVDEGESLIREAASLLQLEPLGEQSLQYAETLESLGIVSLYRHEFQQANDAFTKSLAIRRANPGDNQLVIADSLFNLGMQHSLAGDYELAEPFLVDCLQIRREYYQKDGVAIDHMDVASAQFLLGKVYIVKSEMEKAMLLLQQAATTVDRLQGSNGISAILSLFTQAQLLEKFGNVEAARKLYLQMDEKAVKLLGEDHLIVAFGRSFYGKFLLNNREFEQGVDVLRGVVEVYKKELGPEARGVGVRLIDIARALRYLGKPEEAEKCIRECVGIYRSLETPHRWPFEHAQSLHIFGAIRDNLGDREQGKLLLLEGFESLHQNEEKNSKRGEMIARDYAAMLLNFDVAGPNFRGHSGAGETAELNFELATKWGAASKAQQLEVGDFSSAEILMQEHFECQAMLRLTDAIAGGFEDAMQIKENPAFDSIRDRDDFQALMKKIAD